MESSCCPYNRHQITDFFSGNDSKWYFLLKLFNHKNMKMSEGWLWKSEIWFKNVKQTLYPTGPFILYSFNGLIGNVQICNCLFLRMFYRENEENLIQIIRKLIKKKGVFSLSKKHYYNIYSIKWHQTYTAATFQKWLKKPIS